MASFLGKTDNVFEATSVSSTQSSATSVTSTPSGKRALSNTSTPSPSTCVQVTKKVKIPSPQPDKMSNPLTSTETATIVQTVMQQISEQLKTTIADHVQVSVTAMANSVAAIITASFNDRISSLEAENKNLREEVQLFSDKIKTLESDRAFVHGKLDEAEQYSRRSCLRISGISETPDEVTDNIVIKVAQACGTKITLNDIDRSHRIRQRQPKNSQRPDDIIVKFVSYRSRSSFYWGKSKLKGSADFKGVYINEDLTSQRANLLRSARQLVKNKALLGAWSSDGRIYVKQLDGTKSTIRCKDDISTFTQQ